MKIGCQVFLLGENQRKSLKNRRLLKPSIGSNCILMGITLSEVCNFYTKKAAEAAFPTVPKSPFKRNWPFWTMHG